MELVSSFIDRKLNPLDITISALEKVGFAKTLSSPSLVLINGQQGIISQGVQIPYQSVDKNGNPKTELVKATLTLNVEPLLLPDGRILLKLNLNNNSPSKKVKVNNQPGINTFTIQQNFIVPDGGTIVIGGVLQRNMSNYENGIPILRRIPLLGWLFKGKEWSKDNNEVYVIVTAQVISD
jgi:type IV pilus assembly protein PilQ